MKYLIYQVDRNGLWQFGQVNHTPFVHYCLFNLLLQVHRVAVNMTWELFHGYMRNHLKECPPPALAGL